jgi:hypothetical protein
MPAWSQRKCFRINASEGESHDFLAIASDWTKKEDFTDKARSEIQTGGFEVKSDRC